VSDWVHPGVAGNGGASLLADIGHEIPTALLPSLLTSTRAGDALGRRRVGDETFEVLVERITDGQRRRSARVATQVADVVENLAAGQGGVPRGGGNLA